MMKSPIKGFLIAVSYGVESAGMAYANKALIRGFNYDYPYFLMTCQMLSITIILEVLRLGHVVNLAPFSLERGKSFLAPAILYSFYSVLTLSILNGMNVPTCGVLKWCKPVLVLIMTSVFLKKLWPSPLVMVSATLITTGGIIMKGYADLFLDVNSSGCGLLNVIVLVFYLVLIQKYGQDSGVLEALQLNGYNTLPFMMICALITGDMIEGIRHFQIQNLSFLCVFTIVILMGCLLNYLLFLCTTYNSALATIITGASKCIIQTILGAFAFGSVSAIAFIVLETCGLVLYTYAKYQDFQKEDESDEKITVLNVTKTNVDGQWINNTFGLRTIIPSNA